VGSLTPGFKASSSSTRSSSCEASTPCAALGRLGLAARARITSIWESRASRRAVEGDSRLNRAALERTNQEGSLERSAARDAGQRAFVATDPRTHSLRSRARVSSSSIELLGLAATVDLTPVLTSSASSCRSDAEAVGAAARRRRILGSAAPPSITHPSSTSGSSDVSATSMVTRVDSGKTRTEGWTVRGIHGLFPG
jgi:hypothetical protein